MTIIVADTTCGLPRDILTQRGIPVIPQIVMFGEESYHDDKDFDTTIFLQKLKASATLPKTSAPEPSLYFPIFEAAQKKGESVVVVAPTSKASGTVRSAQTAAQEFPATGEGQCYSANGSSAEYVRLPAGRESACSIPSLPRLHS